MKRILYISFTLIFVVSLLASITTQVAFTVNKNYIIKELCKERKSKQNLCMGTCYLNKQLSQTQEKQKPIQTEEAESFQLFCMDVNPSVALTQEFLLEFAISNDVLPHQFFIDTIDKVPIG